ncbi:MAG: hypothetical protein HQ568_02705 [Calditrichaeota bacterium]|nr:hypothetical protein [Calditrichota bacterium]
MSIPITGLYHGYWTGETEGKMFEPGIDVDTIKQLGEGLLSAFADTVEPGVVHAVEEQFRIPLVDPDTGEYIIDLVRVFDLLETDDASHPVVVDHKTAAKRPSDADLDQNLQTC